jgi:hypothetical protein
VRRALAALAVAAALTGLGIGTALLQGARRGSQGSALPAADNPGPHGLAAARELLLALRAPVSVRHPGEPMPPGAAVVIVAAPRASLAGAELSGLLEEARAGATLVIALGAAPQPALLDALGLAYDPGRAPRLTRGTAPHPLVGDLTLPARSAALRVVRPGALAVSGDERAAAVSAPAGAGEVLVLSGPEPLENAHQLEGDAVTQVTRQAALGPVVFDERFLAPAAPPPAPRQQAVGLLALQLLLGGLVLVAARARRLGAVRPPPPAAAARTARAYLASLAALYRRAGAEEELAASTWHALRRRLDRRHALPASLSDGDAARRVARRSATAAVALARGSAALAAGGEGVLLRVTRAAAEAEKAMGGRG